jgi:hypothetical protein
VVIIVIAVARMARRGPPLPLPACTRTKAISCGSSSSCRWWSLPQHSRPACGCCTSNNRCRLSQPGIVGIGIDAKPLCVVGVCSSGGGSSRPVFAECSALLMLLFLLLLLLLLLLLTAWIAVTISISSYGLVLRGVVHSQPAARCCSAATSGRSSLRSPRLCLGGILRRSLRRAPQLQRRRRRRAVCAAGPGCCYRCSCSVSVHITLPFPMLRLLQGRRAIGQRGQRRRHWGGV